jgi:hypothetical protein
MVLLEFNHPEKGIESQIIPFIKIKNTPGASPGQAHGVLSIQLWGYLPKRFIDWVQS